MPNNADRAAVAWVGVPLVGVKGTRDGDADRGEFGHLYRQFHHH